MATSVPLQDRLGPWVLRARVEAGREEIALGHAEPGTRTHASLTFLAWWLDS